MKKKTEQPGRLTVSRLIVRGVLGIEESTIDLGEVTVLQGHNASGKSSHLAALRAALGIDRTTLARLSHLQDGSPAEKPEVEVILVGTDHEGQNLEVQVRRRGDGSPEVRERVGDDWRPKTRPVEWLRELIDVQGANPAVLLAMKDEDLAGAILEAMPLPGYDRKAALAAAGLPEFRLPAIPTGLHPLEDLEQIEAAIAGARTEVGREERRERDAAVKLLSGLPAEAPESVADRIAQGEHAVSTLAAEIAREEEAADSAEREARAAAKSTYDAVLANAQGDFRTEAARLRREHEARAAEIRAEAERAVSADLAATEQAIHNTKEAGEATLEAATRLMDEKSVAAHAAREQARSVAEGRKRTLAEGREALAALRAQQASIDTDRHVRATADAAKKAAEAHAERVAALSRAIEALRQYKLRLASELPVKGLAVQFDDRGRKSLTLDGVPLAQVNDGRRAELVTEVAVLRGRAPADGRPYLPLVLLDGIERLDPARRAALLRSVAARGTQVIAAVVGPDALQVLRNEDALQTAGASA